jgi:deoxyadenosine/deoxycytidine kinase
MNDKGMNIEKELSDMRRRLEFNGTKNMIVTFGAPGAGKTTLLRGLKKNHPESIIISETNKILNKGTRLGRNLVKATEGDKDLYFQFQMAILPERFTKCFSAPDNSLVDDSIFGTYAYSDALRELKWISKEEHATFLQNFYLYMNFHPRPTKIVYLFCEIDTLQRRIEERVSIEKNRELEVKYDKEYLEALSQSFEKSADFFTSLGYDFIRIGTEELNVDQVVEKVKGEIEQVWKFDGN